MQGFSESDSDSDDADLRKKAPSLIADASKNNEIDSSEDDKDTDLVTTGVSAGFSKPIRGSQWGFLIIVFYYHYYYCHYYYYYYYYHYSY